MKFRWPQIFFFDRRLEQKLDSAIVFLKVASLERKALMATLQNLLDKVNEQTTLISGVQTLITDLRAQVSNLPGITPAQQAQIDEIFTDLDANDAALTAALAANTTPPDSTNPPAA